MPLSDLNIFEKMNTRFAFILLAVTSIFLFGSNELIDNIGLNHARDEYKTWVGVSWLFSLGIVLADMLTPLLKFFRSKILWSLRQRKLQKRLHQLSEDEKGFLFYYLKHDTRTQPAPMSSGTVNGLVSSKVISLASSFPCGPDMFAYNIHPWALEYLIENPECLYP